MTDAAERQRQEAAKALKFMLIKAAVFIGIPIVASIVAVLALM